MEGTKELITTDEIRNKVYIIRGQQVMLDRDLAEIYGYEVKKLNWNPSFQFASLSSDLANRLHK